MSKILTDEKLIDKFLNRGVENVYPSKESLKEKLMSGDKIRAYQGFDPTGPFLHIGHAMGIRALRILQQLGHEVIFLVGDFTSKVGDPDKTNARKMLTDLEIEKNMSGWKEQAANLIDFDGDNPVLFKRNHDWLSKLNLSELIELMSKTTAQQMIERDMFSKRLKKGDPIGLQEFIYPLMQGFDGVEMDVDLELGGTDQIFNMLMGRTLSKQLKGKEKFVRANMLMEAPDQLTMSKTKGNGINLSDTPEDMYGKAMSYSDDFIVKGLTLLTNADLKNIKDIENDLNNNKNQMKHKKFMAFEVVNTILGKDAAKKAQSHFEKTVQNKEASDMVKVSAKKTSLLSFLKEAVVGKSSGEIKRIVEQGGVEVAGEKKTDPQEEIDFKKGDKIKFGKRTWFQIN